MEVSLSGNALRTLTRCVTSLARVGSELVLRASAAELVLQTLNASRSAYQSVALKPAFFDAYSLRAPADVQCSVLLKSVCAVLRTPVAALDRLDLLLLSPDAPKLQWTLHCLNGVKKTYWISCNVEPEIHQLSLDRRRFPSSLVVRPRDLSRLLANFQSSLQEITIIATEPAAGPSDAGGEIGGKSVELRSYIDPLKDNTDATLHTQLWIDPGEEFLQYTHARDPVDITFGVKELKAFLSFCEGCEVDIHLFFEKAGEPILLAPRFGFDDASCSDFDATLVLATMLVSQLNEGTAGEHPSVAQAPQDQVAQGLSASQRITAAMPSTVSENPSDHTKIWSDLSVSAAKSTEVGGKRQMQMEGNPNSSLQNDMQGLNMMNAARSSPARQNATDIQQPMEVNHLDQPQDKTEMNGNPNSQHHPSNWVGETDDDDEEDEGELYVQSTPHYDD